MIYEFLGKKINYDFKDNTSEFTLVFLHGFGCDKNYFSFYFEHFFSQGFKVLSLDFFGHGESDSVDKNFCVYDYSCLVENLLENLKIKNAILVSHSFGGRVAMILSSRKNSKIKGNVFISAAGVKYKKSLKEKTQIFVFKISKILSKIRLLNSSFLNHFGSEEFVNLSIKEKEVYKRIISEDLSYTLKEILVPTLIIFGDEDSITPLYMARKMKKRILNSRLIILKKSGHFAFLEQKEKVIKEIEKFLRSEDFYV